MRDGRPLTIDGGVYQTMQTITNRSESKYENVLILNDQLANIVTHNYTCKVAGSVIHGSTSQTFGKKLPEIVIVRQWSVSNIF